MEPPRKNFRETAKLYVDRLRKTVDDYRRDILHLARERDQAQFRFRVYCTLACFFLGMLLIVGALWYFFR